MSPIGSDAALQKFCAPDSGLVFPTALGAENAGYTFATAELPTLRVVSTVVQGNLHSHTDPRKAQARGEHAEQCLKIGLAHQSTGLAATLCLPVGTRP